VKQELTRLSLLEQLPAAALGAREEHGEANATCAYCWPTLIDASFRDAGGLPCCHRCGLDSNRRSPMPRFMRADFRREAPHVVA